MIEIVATLGLFCVVTLTLTFAAFISSWLLINKLFPTDDDEP